MSIPIKGVVNIDIQDSTPRLEGLNSKVRLVSHRAYGFHSADTVIAMLYLCCADIHIELPHRWVTRKPRGEPLFVGWRPIGLP